MTAKSYEGQDRSALIEHAEAFEKLAQDVDRAVPSAFGALPKLMAEGLEHTLAHVHRAWKNNCTGLIWRRSQVHLAAKFRTLISGVGLRWALALPLALIGSAILGFASDNKSSAEAPKAEARDSAIVHRNFEMNSGPNLERVVIPLSPLVLVLVAPPPTQELQFSVSNIVTTSGETHIPQRPTAPVSPTSKGSRQNSVAYTPVRKTERFKALVRQAGLVEYWKTRGWPVDCRPVGADDFECD